MRTSLHTPFITIRPPPKSHERESLPPARASAPTLPELPDMDWPPPSVPRPSSSPIPDDEAPTLRTGKPIGCE